MRKFLMLNILLLISATSIFAQLDKVTISGIYSISLTNQMEVNSLSGMGVEAKIRYAITENTGITFGTGFRKYSFSQDDALKKWDWRYWDYYYQFVETTLTEEEYTAVLSPFQKMDVIPVFLQVDYKISLSETVALSPFIGAGVSFFTRRLYVTEDWARYFDEIDYRFAYSFRNIGPEKSGNPVFLKAGVNFEYEFSEDYYLATALDYQHYLNTANNPGYNFFTHENELSLTVGIGFGY